MKSLETLNANVTAIHPIVIRTFHPKQNVSLRVVLEEKSGDHQSQWEIILLMPWMSVRNIMEIIPIVFSCGPKWCMDQPRFLHC